MATDKPRGSIPPPPASLKTSSSNLQTSRRRFLVQLVEEDDFSKTFGKLKAGGAVVLRGAVAQR